MGDITDTSGEIVSGEVLKHQEYFVVVIKYKGRRYVSVIVSKNEDISNIFLNNITRIINNLSAREQLGYIQRECIKFFPRKHYHFKQFAATSIFFVEE